MLQLRETVSDLKNNEEGVYCVNDCISIQAEIKEIEDILGLQFLIEGDYKKDINSGIVELDYIYTLKVDKNNLTLQKEKR